MRCFIDIEVHAERENTLFFIENDGRKYSYDLQHLAELDERFAAVANCYRDPFVLTRSVYYTRIPDSIVSFVDWANDSCDIPVGGFYSIHCSFLKILEFFLRVLFLIFPRNRVLEKFSIIAGQRPVV